MRFFAIALLLISTSVSSSQFELKTKLKTILEEQESATLSTVPNIERWVAAEMHKGSGSTFEQMNDVIAMPICNINSVARGGRYMDLGAGRWTLSIPSSENNDHKFRFGFDSWLFKGDQDSASMQCVADKNQFGGYFHWDIAQGSDLRSATLMQLYAPPRVQRCDAIEAKIGLEVGAQVPQDALIAELWVKRKDKWEFVTSSFVGQTVRDGEEVIRAEVNECYSQARLILKTQFPQWFQQKAGVRLHSATLQMF